MSLTFSTPEVAKSVVAEPKTEAAININDNFLVLVIVVCVKIVLNFKTKSVKINFCDLNVKVHRNITTTMPKALILN